MKSQPSSMRLLILIALFNLSLGSSVSITNGNWVTPPINITSFLQQSAEAAWLVFDVNYDPVILNVNYSTPNASTTTPGMSVSTYSINQATLNNHTLNPVSGDNTTTYFINFPSPYSISPAGSMISLQILQDSKGINQIFYQYNDLIVDQNVKNGFKSFIADLTNFVEQLVQEVTLVGTETIDAFKDYNINMSNIASGLQDCASGLTDMKNTFKDVHENVKSKSPQSAVKSLFGTGSSLVSLFLTCTNQSITIPDEFENVTKCGESLVNIAETIAGFSVAPEAFIGDALKLVPMIQSIPSTISTCTGAFSLNSTTSSIPTSGSGYLTDYTVNTEITLSSTYRTSKYFGILLFVGKSLEMIAIQLDSNTSKTMNLTANLDSSQLCSCANGGAINSDSMFCVWVESATSDNNPYVIKGVIVDFASGSVSSNAVVWVQSNSTAFQHIYAFVTSKSYGISYLYEGNDQLYAISNLNTTSCNLGAPIDSDRNLLLLSTINGPYLYIFWESATTGPTDVTYEIYDQSCDLVGTGEEIISYGQGEANTSFVLMNNGAGVYGLIQSGSTFQLGLVVSSPIGLVSSLFLLYSTIMTLFLL